MPRPTTKRGAPLLLLSALALAAGAAPDAGPTPEPTPVTVAAPDDPDWTILRVGGAPEAEVSAAERSGTTIYRAGKARVDESLPEGYPRPTPPGAIELKRYPEVRRAEIRGEGSGDFKMMGRAASKAFWPLFRHIKARGIPMTAPVETNYEGITADRDAQGWSMAFLYRNPELGPAGPDGRITVSDASPLTVLSIGVRGRLNEPQFRAAMSTLETWLADSGQWTRAGDARTLGYNGPNVWAWNRWWEVQIPVVPTPPATAPVPAMEENPGLE